MNKPINFKPQTSNFKTNPKKPEITNFKFPIWIWLIGIYFVVCSLSLGFSSKAFAKDFDGVWFLGFNLQKPPFNDLKVRQAVSSCLDLNSISSRLMSEESGASVIPPGMTGNDPALAPYKNNIDYARLLMKRAKYSPNDRRLRKLTLLHTDGVKTIAIARQVQNDLKALGMRVELAQVSYRDETKWDRELRSGKHQLFLMGYKAEAAQIFSAEATAGDSGPESATLLEPLFKTGGPANFTGYSNPSVDMMLDQLSVINPALSKERELKLKEINKDLYKDLPVVVLFYIEKL
jgi:peptide/nickel transport system substrate-binding protein